MSEVADGSELATKAEESATKRKTLTMGDRTKVIDFLRSRVEPVSADSNQAIASLVSEGSKVDINWTQLKYMIEDESMAEWKLGEKVHLKVPGSSESSTSQEVVDRLSSVENRIAVLKLQIEYLQTRVAFLSKSAGLTDDGAE